MWSNPELTPQITTCLQISTGHWIFEVLIDQHLKSDQTYWLRSSIMSLEQYIFTHEGQMQKLKVDV